MWVIADTTNGFFLEYWLVPEKQCVASFKADCDLDTLEALMRIMRAFKVEPR